MFADETAKVVERECPILGKFDSVLRQITTSEGLVCQTNLLSQQRQQQQHITTWLIALLLSTEYKFTSTFTTKYKVINKVQGN